MKRAERNERRRAKRVVRKTFEQHMSENLDAIQRIVDAETKKAWADFIGKNPHPLLGVYTPAPWGSCSGTQYTWDGIGPIKAPTGDWNPAV